MYLPNSFVHERVALTIVIRTGCCSGSSATRQDTSLRRPSASAVLARCGGLAEQKREIVGRNWNFRGCRTGAIHPRRAIPPHGGRIASTIFVLHWGICGRALPAGQTTGRRPVVHHRRGRLGSIRHGKCRRRSGQRDCRQHLATGLPKGAGECGRAGK